MFKLDLQKAEEPDTAVTHCRWAKCLQSCQTLCNTMDCSLPGSFVHGDSPGKNTGVGCHVLLHGIFSTLGWNSGLPLCRWILYHWDIFLFKESLSFESESVSHSVVSDSLQLHGLLPTRLLCPWNSPDKNTGVGCHALLQGIFPTQELNPGLPHCMQIFHPYLLEIHNEVFGFPW